MNENTAKRSANLWSTLSLAIVCATIAFVVGKFVTSAKEHAPRRLWTPIVVTPDGNETEIQAGSRRLEFWTPSVRTKDHLSHEDGAIRERDQWEVIASDEPVRQFGMLLRTNSNVLGYRRAEVWGHGRTSLKPGWWWTMTVVTNYTVQDFIGAYRAFWKSSNAVFVEVTENPGPQ